MLPITTPVNMRLPGMPVSSFSSRSVDTVASFATNPTVPGTPAMDAAAAAARTTSAGLFRPSPDSSRMSRVPVVRSMAPTIMNNVALNRACDTVRASPARSAPGEPIPTTAMMKPS